MVEVLREVEYSERQTKRVAFNISKRKTRARCVRTVHVGDVETMSGGKSAEEDGGDGGEE